MERPRQRTLRLLADRIGHERAIRLPGFPLRVGIDGVDGAGKTTLADELADRLETDGLTVIRAGVDSFHNPRAVRYRRGRNSPVGFLEDSFDVDALVNLLLAPLAPDGSRVIRTAVFDHRVDRPVLGAGERVDDHVVLVLDGIFLHRPAIVAHLDFTVWLEVPFTVSVPRMAVRDGSDPDPDSPGNLRYVEGQRLYLSRHSPRSAASVVVDNS